MQLPHKDCTLRTFRVDLDGGIKEGDPITLRNPLFSHAFPGEEAALLRLEVPDETGFERMAQALRLVKAIEKGVRGYRVLGGGHGVKAGKLYAARPGVVERVHRHFSTSEDCLAYGTLWFSEAKHVLRLDGARVTGKGDGDGQGLIDPEVLAEHGLPARQIQVRAVWEGAIAKGTLFPRAGLRETEGAGVLFHETMMKGTGRDTSGPFLLAIREIAEVRTFNSSWTFTQLFPDTVQDRLFERYSRPMLAAVKRAMESNDSALAFLDAIAFETDEDREARDILSSVLAAGLSTKHPWCARRLQALVRRAYLHAALSLGPIPMSGGMACVVDDDRCRHHVTANWLPEGNYAIARYPIRDGWSLRMVRNRHSKDVPEGSVAVHPILMAELDGDQDGDAVCLVSDRDVQRGVQAMHRREPPRLPIPPKTRKATPLRMLARVAVDSLGSAGVGSSTWFVSAAVDKGRFDLVPRLSLRLQQAVMSMKWNIEDKDYAVIEECEKDLELPSWLKLAQERSTFSTKAPRVEPIGLGKYWNLCAEAFEKDVLASAGALRDFADAVPLPDGNPDFLAEAEVMRVAFNRRVAQSEGDEEEIRQAIRTVADWAATKKGDDRTQWGRTCWFLAHRNPSPKSTGAFALHGFVDALCRDLQDTSGYRRPLEVPEEFDACSRMVETFEGRSVIRSRMPVATRTEGSEARTTLVRLIGAHRAISAAYGVDEKEAVLYLARIIDESGPDAATVDFRWTDSPTNGHKVLSAAMGDDPLGIVPEDQAAHLDGRLVGTRKAHLLLRGRTVYATVTLA